MSIVYYYVRVHPDSVNMLTDDNIFGQASANPVDLEVIDIDKAHEALAWLVSSTKRAEVAHNRRLSQDPDWAANEARANVARLNTMPMDDVLVAIQGSASYAVEAPELPFLATILFPPKLVRSLSASLAALTESGLREHLDFQVMEDENVAPGEWLTEGEETFTQYLMPALRRLQEFYETAAGRDQAVLLLAG